jgi:para-nitrobenzyl esterase
MWSPAGGVVGLALALTLAGADSARAEGTLESPRLDAGAISGVLVEKEGAAPVRAFKGIPFAAPPVGALRWKPPQPVAPWEGVRACDTFGPVCPQPAVPFFLVPGPRSEDCLYLNVWTGAADPGAKLPVMVWIHGGSLIFGAASQGLYDGAPLARRGVVVVTINYRLGPFGFLAHPALSKESPEGVSGNYGLLDQLAALEWVKKNVAAFGGDPGCVTIFGESAGGGSVQALLLSPLAKGLFHRAIVQSAICSAPPLRGGAPGVESAEAAGERFAAAIGVPPASDPASGDLLAALRAKSPAELLAASAGPPEVGTTTGVTFGLCADGLAIPADPVELVAAGKQADVPLLIGTTADEGTLFVGTIRTRADLTKAIDGLFGAQAPKVAEAYPASSDGEAKRVAARLLADSIFVAPTRAFVRARPGFTSKAWLYAFTRAPMAGRLLGLGAHHGCELGYVFETLDAPGAMGIQPIDRTLAATVSATWVRFAQTGDPTGQGLPEWPAYTAENDAHLELGDKVQPGSGLRKAQCDLLERVWAELRTSAKPLERRFY